MKKAPATEEHKKISEAISSVWENKDFNLLRDILSSNVKWFEGPFKEPLTSISAVVKQWQTDLANQKDIVVETDVVAINGRTGIYNFDADWNDENGTHRLNGIFKVVLNEEGKIEKFCQWWTEKLPKI